MRWLLVLCLSGCGLSQQGTNATVIYAKDGCLFYVEGMSMEQVRDKEKEWEFDENCNISVKMDIE